MIVGGSASDIISATSSMDVNFNTYNYVLTTDLTPDTDNNYTADPAYPKLVLMCGMKLEIKLSAMGLLVLVV